MIVAKLIEQLKKLPQEEKVVVRDGGIFGEVEIVEIIEGEYYKGLIFLDCK